MGTDDGRDPASRRSKLPRGFCSPLSPSAGLSAVHRPGRRAAAGKTWRALRRRGSARGAATSPRRHYRTICIVANYKPEDIRPPASLMDVSPLFGTHESATPPASFHCTANLAVCIGGLNSRDRHLQMAHLPSPRGRHPAAHSSRSASGRDRHRRSASSRMAGSRVVTASGRSGSLRRSRSS